MDILPRRPHLLGCGHQLHSNCAKRMAMYDPLARCPLCRAPGQLPVEVVTATQSTMAQLAVTGDVVRLRRALRLCRGWFQAGDPLNAVGSTLLQTAVLAGAYDAARMMLDAGADPDAPGAHGVTPLQTAAGWIAQEHGLGATTLGRWQLLPCDATAVTALLDAGADPDGITDRVGVPPLLVAVISSNEEAVAALLAAGADVNLRCEDARVPRLYGLTPLCAAVEFSDGDTVAALLAAGANPNRACLLGHTPLMFACAAGSWGIVTDLMKAGANPAAVDQSGRTAAGWAVDCGNYWMGLMMSRKTAHSAPGCVVQ